MNNPSLLTSSWPPCVVGTVSTRANWEEMSSPSLNCDLLEWRIDLLLQEMNRKELSPLKPPALPVLITIRDASEGGAGNLSREDRISLFHDLLPYASAIDIEVASLPEFDNLIAEAKEKNIIVIGSAHNFQSAFSEKKIREIDASGRKYGADLIKIAHMLKTPSDILIGSTWLEESTRTGHAAALMGMGTLGPVSRFLHAQLGSRLIYGYLGDSPTAPGQLPANDFSRVLGKLCAYTQD